MTCKIEGCVNKAIAHGICMTHYMRVYRHGSIMICKDSGRPGSLKCLVCGEDREKDNMNKFAKCQRCRREYHRTRTRKWKKSHGQRWDIIQKQYRNRKSRRAVTPRSRGQIIGEVKARAKSSALDACSPTSAHILIEEGELQ